MNEREGMTIKERICKHKHLVVYKWNTNTDTVKCGSFGGGKYSCDESCTVIKYLCMDCKKIICVEDLIEDEN